MPEISIIVPVYKVEKYLDRCVQSILNQTFTDFELILVDDGSPDNCPQMCDEWAKKDERIRVIHKENGGVSAARNVGLDNAKGNFIGFVDSDDWILPNMYEMLYDLLENGKYDISICGIKRTASEIVTDVINDSNEKNVYLKNEYLAKVLKVNTQDSNHYPWNKLYKKEVMNNVRFPERLSIGEDVESTFLAVLNSEKIIETKQIGYIYWLNLESATVASFDEKQLDYIKICDRIVDIAKGRCSEKIIEYAKQFRCRASFGILCKMVISEISDDFDKKYYSKKFVDEVKQYYWILLKNNMPFSRKIIMTCMCINYPVTELIMGVVAKIFRNKIRLRF